jgi:hypothetical protein
MSRALWLREGDKNTKFFRAKSNRRNNSVDSFVGNGTMFFSFNSIEVSRLERTFMESEVLEVVRTLNCDNAPCP